MLYHQWAHFEDHCNFDNRTDVAYVACSLPVMGIFLKYISTKYLHLPKSVLKMFWSKCVKIVTYENISLSTSRNDRLIAGIKDSDVKSVNNSRYVSHVLAQVNATIYALNNSADSVLKFVLKISFQSYNFNKKDTSVQVFSFIFSAFLGLPFL